MKNGIMGCIAGALGVLWVVDTALAAEATGGPYHAIVDRNVFGLKAPPPPPPTEPPAPPPPNIKLQGITTLLGKKLALMKVLVAGTKPGAKSEEVPLTLTIGQKQEGVEVLEIQEAEPKFVKVNNNGIVVSLNFKDNGVNLATAAPPAGMPPGGPPRPGMGVPPPGVNPAAPPAHTLPASPYERRIPVNKRYPGAAAAYNQAAPQNTYSAVPMTPGAAMPNTPGQVALGGLGAPASAIQPAKNWPPENQFTPEEAAIHEAAYTLKYQKEIQAGTMPSIPGGNPILDSGNPQQGNTQSRF